MLIVIVVLYGLIFLVLLSEPVVKRVAQHYLSGLFGGTVKIKSARYNAFQDLVLENLRIPLAAGERDAGEVLLRRVRLVTPLLSLLENRTIAHRVIIQDPRIIIALPPREEEKTLSVPEKLEQIAAAILDQSGQMLNLLPAIYMQRASVEIRRDGSPQDGAPRAGQTVLSDFDFRIEPQPGGRARFGFTCKCAHFGHVELEGRLDPKKKYLSIETRPDITLPETKYYVKLSELQNRLPFKADQPIQAVCDPLGRLHIKKLLFEYNGLAKNERAKVTAHLAASADGLNIVHGKSNKTLGNVAVVAKYERQKLSVDIRGTLDGSELALTGTVDGLDGDARVELAVAKARFRFDSGTQRYFESIGQKDLARLHLKGDAVIGADGASDAFTISRRRGTEPEIRGVARLEGFSLKHLGTFEIDDLSGPVEFAGNKISVGPLKGIHKDKEQKVTITGDIVNGGTFRDSSHRFAVTFDKYEIDEQALQIASKEEIEDFWNVYNPSGALRLTVRIDKPVGRTRENFTYEVIPLKVAILFKDFPYPLNNITGGKVTIKSDDVLIEGLKNVAVVKDPKSPYRGNKCTIVMSGHIDPAGNDSELKIKATGLLLDDALYGILKQTDHPIADQWEWVRPRGIVNLTTPVDFGTGKEPSEPTIIKSVNVDIACRDFPFPFKGIHSGTIEIAKDRTRIIDLKSTKGDETIVMNATLSGSGEELNVDVRVEAKNLRIDDRLKKAFKAQPQLLNLFETFSPSGTLDASVKIFGKPDINGKSETGAMSDTLQTEAVIKLKKLECKLKEFPYPISGLSGEIRLDNKKVVMDHLISRESDGSVIQIDGETTDIDTPTPNFRLSISGEKIPVQGKLRSALVNLSGTKVGGEELGQRSEFIRSLFERYDPRGTVFVEARLKGPAGELFPAGSFIELKLDDIALGGGLDLSNLKGTISIHPKLIEMPGIRGTLGRGEFFADVQISLEDEPAYTINDLRITNLDLAGDLPRLAENFGLAELVKDIAISGRAYLQLKTTKALHFKGNRLSAGRFRGTIRLDRTTFFLGTQTYIENAEFTFAGHAKDGRVWVSGQASAGALTVNAQKNAAGSPLAAPLDESIAPEKGFLINKPAFAYSLTTRPGEPTVVKIYEASGLAYGGHLAGDLRIDASKHTLAFTASAAVRDMNLQKLLTHFGFRTNEFLGRCSGSLRLQSPSPDPRDVFGRCRLDIYDARLYELPLVLAVLNLLSLSPFERTAFNRAEVEFDFYEKEMHLDKFDLLGRTLSVFGSGHIKPGSAMNIKFNANVAPPVLSLIPGFRKLWRSLVRVRVTGTDFDQFTAELEPVTSALLPAEKTSRGRKKQ